MSSDRKPAHRIRTVRRGDPITAGLLNALADGVNEALKGPAPPRSLTVRSDANQVTEIVDSSVEQALDDGVRVFTATAWTLSTVRVFNEQDAEQWVDVERVDVVDLTDTDGNVIRFVLSPIWQ